MPIISKTPLDPRVVALAPRPITRINYWFRHAERSLRGAAETRAFQALDTLLTKSCSADNVEIAPAHACWDIFNYTQDDRNILVFESACDFHALYQTYKEKTDIYDSHCVVSTLFENISKLSLNKDNLSLEHLIFQYIGSVLLEVAKKSTNETARHKLLSHVDKTLNTIFQNKAIFQTLDTESQRLIQTTINRNSPLKKHLSISYPISDTLPEALQKLKRETENLATRLNKILFIVSTGGDKKESKLNTSPEGILSHRYADNHPFKKQLQETQRFMNLALQAQTRHFPFDTLNPPGKEDVSNYVEQSLGYILYTPPILHSLLQVDDSSNQDASVLRWAKKTDIPVLQTASQTLMKLSNWVFYITFLAHKSRDFDLVLKKQLLNQTEAIAFSEALKELDKRCEVLLKELGGIYKDVADHQRTEKGDHDILTLLDNAMKDVDRIRTLAIQPLTEIETIRQKLVDTYVKLEKQQSEEAAWIAEKNPFQNFNSLDFTLPSRTAPLQITAARAAPFRLTQDTRVVALEEEFDERRDLPTSLQEPRSLPAEAARPDADLPTPMQASPWKKILLTALTLAAIAFIITAALCCTGTVALPAFFAAMGMVKGGLALASIIAAGILFLSSFVAIGSKFSSTDNRVSSQDEEAYELSVEEEIAAVVPSSNPLSDLQTEVVPQFETPPDEPNDLTQPQQYPSPLVPSTQPASDHNNEVTRIGIRRIIQSVVTLGVREGTGMERYLAFKENPTASTLHTLCCALMAKFVREQRSVEVNTLTQAIVATLYLEINSSAPLSRGEIKALSFLATHPLLEGEGKIEDFFTLPQAAQFMVA